MKIIAILRALSVTVALVLGALILYAGEPNNSWWWAGALPFALWVIGPAVAPFLIARHKPRQWFSITMFLYVVASSIFSGFAYYDAFFRSKSSTEALVMVFIPLYQWLALTLLLLLCLGVTTWLTQRGKIA
jgi:uncharacterized Tic20 family protein